MAKQSTTIYIPLKEREALAGLLAVKPTADMPRSGAAKKPKKRTRRK